MNFCGLSSTEKPARGLYTWPLLTLLFSMKLIAGIKCCLNLLSAMILIDNFRLISQFRILRSPSEGSSPVLGSSMWRHPGGGRNAGQAPVKPSQTTLLKEPLSDTGKPLCVWFSGNVTNICKRFGLLRRRLPQCSVLSGNPPCAEAQSSQQQWRGRAQKATKKQQEPSGSEYSQNTESTIQALKSTEFWKQLQQWKEG